MYKVKVLSPGLLTTVQDEGRFGYMNMGFSSNGAMDIYSMKLANILCGNAVNDGVLEMTLLGAELEICCDSVISLTGADMKPTLNGKEIDMYRAVEVKSGDVLKMSMAEKGMRCYLAFCGGFDLPIVMGSMSTNLKCAIGGYSGRKLMAGDELMLRRSSNISYIGKRHISPENDYEKEVTVRVVLGPQDEYFTEKGKETFLSKQYTVSDKSDRMGVRLDGEMIENKNGVDIISDGIAMGSVQIPASGTPIIMMADRQTTGGYAKIATVISVDLKKIAQARPGDKISFEAISEKEAVRLKKKESFKLSCMEKTMIYSK